jgi:hypothetical protein
VETHLREHTDVDFNLCVVEPTGSRDYHDRHVFTNYGLFKSGRSFEKYFAGNGDVATDTTLDVQPLTDPDVLAAARQKLSEVGKVIENSDEKYDDRKGTVVRAWHGDKRNRLFGTAINDSLGASE